MAFIALAFLIIYTGGCPFMADNKPDYLSEGGNLFMRVLFFPFFIPFAAIWALGYLKVRFWGENKSNYKSVYRTF